MSTLSVHAGEELDETRSLEPPLVMSSAFSFPNAEVAEGAFRGENDAYIYGRWGNPTVEMLERKVAALEGAETAAAAASGMAVISGTLLTLAKAGDHIVAPRAMYGEAARLLRERLPRLGITTTFVDDVSPEGYRAAITPQTRVLYVETPGNPTLAITDIAAIASLAHDHDALCVADNTFATPFCQRPLDLGVDVVVHSMTKFLGGHGDAIAGVALGRVALVDPIRESVIKGFGGALSPFNAFLVSRGLRTFALRMRQATSSAADLAEFLSKHPAVARVFHPSLPDHPGHAIAAKQMRAPVAMVSFELHGGMNAGKRLLESVMLISHAVSLGDVRSLITQPASSTASTMPVEDRRRAGITDGLIRLAVGIEDVEDLRADLDQALATEARA